MHELINEEARDRVTGFRGTVTARYEFSNGCVQYLIEARVKEDGAKAEDAVFDEQRIQIRGERPTNDWKDYWQPEDVSDPERASAGGGFRRTP